MNTKEYVEDLSCELRQDEWESYVRDLTSVDEKVDRYEAELAEQKLRYKQLIESAVARRSVLMELVRTRKERRPVRVEDLLRKDAAGTYVVATVRLDTGEEVRCRTAHPDELQKHLPGFQEPIVHLNLGHLDLSDRSRAKAADPAPQSDSPGPVPSAPAAEPTAPAQPEKPRRGRPPKKAAEETPAPATPADAAPATEPAPAAEDDFERIATEDPSDPDFFGSVE